MLPHNISHISTASRKRLYSIFDILIECDLVIPELQEIGDGSAYLKIGQGQAIQEQDVDWHHNWQENGATFIRFGNLGNKQVIEFPGMTYFTVSLNDLTIEYHASKNTPPESIRHQLLDQVIPRTFGQLGRAVLHASAIKLPDKTGIAFLGDSGWGKSTIASSFLKSGSKLISDDCILIEKIKNRLHATSCYQGVRLFSDSAVAIFPDNKLTAPVAHYSEKQRLILNLPDMYRMPARTSLDALFLLTDPAENRSNKAITIERVHGVEEMMCLIKQTFVLDPLDKVLIAELFKTLGSFMEIDIPIYRLSYPHSHDRLQDTHQAILSLIANGAE